jgi:hypothetical protein
MELADIPVPRTRAGELAREVVTRYSAPALVNHCLRSYLFAASLAAIDDVEIDHELLYVSSLLHDLGLEPAFDNVAAPFEEAGGHVGWVFAAGVGWPESQRDRVSQIIVAHMRDPAVADDPEGYLLAAATSLDISGIDPQRWPDELLHEVVAAHPRLDLGPRFTACFRDQATRKPGSAAAVSVRSGIAARIAANVLNRF